ncbi:MAG: peptide ABC transporter substrate-binding protein [Lachnospiraceae bacterium]
MKKFKKTVSLLLILAMTVTMFAGCGDNGDKKTTTSKGITKKDITKVELADEQIFRYAKSSDATGLNPIICTTAPDNEVSSIIYEGLVRDVADENNESVQEPGAAESWDVSEDGCTYTFHIRKDSNWIDGKPVTADDFVYTLRLMSDPKSGSTAGWLYEGVITNFSEALYKKEGKKPEDIGVKAIDEKTLEITLVKPCGYFLELVSSAYPVRQDVYEQYGDSYGSTVDKIMTNGAFKLVKWENNVKLTYEKNADYWNADKVKLETIEAKIISETATAAQALISGDIDVLYTSDEEWQKMLGETEGIEMERSDGNGPEFLSFNCGNKYFKNPKIRMAFSLAIDREKYNKDLRNNVAEPMYTLMPKVTKVGDKLYNELVNNENLIVKKQLEEYDPKELLIEGLKELGLDEDPAKMEVHLSTRGVEEFSKKSSEWLLQEWKEKLGVTIKIDMMEWNIMWEKVEAGDYEIATCGWGPYFNDPYGLLSIYDPEIGYFNSSKTGWTDADSKAFRKALVESTECADQDERAQILLEAEKLLVGTAVVAPTYTMTDSCYLSDKIGGYYTNPHSTLDLNKIFVIKK